MYSMPGDIMPFSCPDGCDVAVMIGCVLSGGSGSMASDGTRLMRYNAFNRRKTIKRERQYAECACWTIYFCFSSLSRMSFETEKTVPCLIPFGTLSLSVTSSQLLKSMVRMAPYRCFV